MWWMSIVVLAGCYNLPPPPILPPHIDAAPSAVGTSTGMIIFGGATDLGGFAAGVALRFEHQQTDNTTLGVELSGAEVSRGDPGGKGGGASELTHTLFGIRGYGRYAVDNYFATSAGLGFSVLGTGLVTGAVDTGLLVSRPSDTFIPLYALDLAFALPLHNVPFLAEDRSDYVNVPAKPSLLLGMDFGAIVPLGNTGNRLSLDFGWVFGLPITDAIIHTSFADTERF